jgi:hypothetical protein
MSYICGESASIENTVTDLTREYIGKNMRSYMVNFYNYFGLSSKLLNSKIYTCRTLRDRRNGPSNLTGIKKSVPKGESKHFLKKVLKY